MFVSNDDQFVVQNENKPLNEKNFPLFRAYNRHFPPVPKVDPNYTVRVLVLDLG